MNLLVELVVSVLCILFRKEPERLQDGTTPSSLSSVCCFGGNIGALQEITQVKKLFKRTQN